VSPKDWPGEAQQEPKISERVFNSCVQLHVVGREAVRLGIGGFAWGLPTGIGGFAWELPMGIGGSACGLPKGIGGFAWGLPTGIGGSACMRAAYGHRWLRLHEGCLRASAASLGGCLKAPRSLSWTRTKRHQQLKPRIVQLLWHIFTSGKPRITTCYLTNAENLYVSIDTKDYDLVIVCLGRFFGPSERWCTCMPAPILRTTICKSLRGNSFR
jgi:hypothetical protein